MNISTIRQETRPRGLCEEQWSGLLQRNHVLAQEIARLRSDNRLLQRKMSALLHWRLTQSTRSSGERVDAAVQTDGRADESRDPSTAPLSLRRRDGKRASVSPSSYQFLTPSKAVSEKVVQTTPDRSESCSRTPTLSPTVPSRPSPTQTRVTATLSQRLLSSPEEETSRAEERAADQANGRPHRRLRKPVSYKEPSLRVKVRKGFQFFQFVDEG